MGIKCRITMLPRNSALSFIDFYQWIRCRERGLGPLWNLRQTILTKEKFDVLCEENIKLPVWKEPVYRRAGRALNDGQTIES